MSVLCWVLASCFGHGWRCSVHTALRMRVQPFQWHIGNTQLGILWQSPLHWSGSYYHHYSHAVYTSKRFSDPHRLCSISRNSPQDRMWHLRIVIDLRSSPTTELVLSVSYGFRPDISSRICAEVFKYSNGVSPALPCNSDIVMKVVIRKKTTQSGYSQRFLVSGEFKQLM